jgi:tRNA(Arg) A34 adenosine deaminase TadA
MTRKSDLDYLRLAIAVAEKSKTGGNHPFGSILVDENGEVIGEGLNTTSVDGGPGHSEANLARMAARKFAPDFLRKCTLYTSVEPCSMCSGTIYWANIGKVAYGMSEKRLAQMTGDNPENRTQDLPCRDVFKAGQWQVEVFGPFPEVENEVAAAHIGFWDREVAPA